jgi:hypothetical protein
MNELMYGGKPTYTFIPLSSKVAFDLFMEAYGELWKVE